MKHKFALWFGCTLLAGSSFFAGTASAQTKAFRQTNLASSAPGAAANSAPDFVDPWAIAYLPGQFFAIANGGAGTVNLRNALGGSVGSVRVPSVAGAAGALVPTGIAADGSGVFALAGVPLQYVVVTKNGTIAGFSAPSGVVPMEATLERDDSATAAVYTSVALLHPACCAPYVAVANFRDGTIHTFSSSFEPASQPGSFQDPHLPPGYAPYGLQVIANQLFVAYALQNASKDSPVAGSGNGVVDIFDLQGNFVRRFAMGGSLNAPWGIALASANFGPFGGAILIGNSGDGTISAFDAATGNFLGQLTDGDANALVNPGIRGLAFRDDGLADPNTLYFTAATNNGEGGLFGAITSGLVSVTRASTAAAPAKTASLTVTVAAGSGNPGTPTGTVSVFRDSALQGAAPVTGGVATMMLPAAGTSAHAISVQYSGDSKFVPSSTSVMVGPAAAATADFSVGANPGSVSVSPGQSAPVTVTVTPSGGFTANVSLACSSVPGVTCTFGASTLSTSNGTASTMMTINTTMSVPRYGFLAGGGNGGLGSLVAALAILGFMVWRRRRLERVRIPVFGTAAALAIFALLLALGGCGYGSSYTAPTQNSGPAVMTITATSGSISHTATVNVTVQ